LCAQRHTLCEKGMHNLLTFWSNAFIFAQHQLTMSETKGQLAEASASPEEKLQKSR
jgi:hypothetical protein